MTIMLLSGVPEISGVIIKKISYSFSRHWYKGYITGFRYQWSGEPIYLDSHLRFQAERDDSYGFTSWIFTFYTKWDTSYIWKMSVTANYSKVATYEAGSAKEQVAMRECLIEAFSAYDRHTVSGRGLHHPHIWNDLHTMFKKKVLLHTPEPVHGRLRSRGTDDERTMLDQIVDILCDIHTDIYHDSRSYAPTARYERNRTRGCLLTPGNVVIKRRHITDSQSSIVGVYRYDVVSSVPILAPNAPSIEKSVCAYAKESYKKLTIALLLGIPKQSVIEILEASA